MTSKISIHTALQDFATSVAEKMTQLTPGEPEDQVRGAFENFMAALSRPPAGNWSALVAQCTR